MREVCKEKRKGKKGFFGSSAVHDDAADQQLLFLIRIHDLSASSAALGRVVCGTRHGAEALGGNVTILISEENPSDGMSCLPEHLTRILV